MPAWTTAAAAARISRSIESVDSAAAVDAPDATYGRTMLFFSLSNCCALALLWFLSSPAGNPAGLRRSSSEVLTPEGGGGPKGVDDCEVFEVQPSDFVGVVSGRVSDRCVP